VEFSLVQFCEQTPTWPSNPSELQRLASQVARLLEVEFVAILSTENPREMGVYMHAPLGLNRTGLLEYLSQCLNFMPFQKGGISQIPVTPGSFPWSALRPYPHLTSAQIGDRLSDTNRKLGLILVGSQISLPQQNENYLKLCSLHLCDLAAKAALEDDIKVRNQFLSIASHELKTPITSIYGILQLQERMLRPTKQKKSEQFPERERHHSFLKMVIRQVERLNELIDGLLDVSRIQNGRFMVEPTETDVAKLLQECVESRLKVIATDAGVQLKLDASPEFIAWVDPVRLEEVISNLVINAIRFSPEGGVVWIRLKEEEDSFRLLVRDQGPSLPAEDRERIFQPFERVHRSARMGGMGLGLFISRQIALLHGGNVSLIESVPGKGNVFEAYFPKRAQHSAEIWQKSS